jgi:HEAT repeat protein
MGYAAGVAAAMAAKTDTLVRGVDMKALQKHLVEVGNLKPSVLTDQSNFPLAAEQVEAAVKDLLPSRDSQGAAVPLANARGSDPEKDIALILAQPEESRPLVKAAYAQAQEGPAKVKLAEILSVLGDPAGLETLIAAVEALPQLDKGWKYTGMGQYGASMSRLDSLVYALGRLGDRKATPALLAKLKQLTPESDFSHFRALATALDQLRDPAAAGLLAEVLSLSGVRGQAITAIGGALESAKKDPSWEATTPRAEALRELFLARALYRCGDRDGLGKKVLQEYSQDLRGHLARHASAVLGEAKQ